MSWWHGIDSVAHKYGMKDKRVLKKFIDQDQHLLNLIDKIKARGLWDKLTLIVVSDHGMTDISNLINILNASYWTSNIT